MRGSEVRATLIAMLEDESAAKRRASAIVFAELAPDDPEVLDALRAAARNDDDARVRRWIVEAIGAIAAGKLKPRLALDMLMRREATAE